MPESQLALSVGDRVVYPKQGVCRVAGVESKEVAGQKLVFVTMRREEDGAVMMVPQGKVQSIGLRKIATKEEVQKIIGFLAEDPEKADLDWKQRKIANLDRMTQGGIQGLAEVVKGLQVLSELRPLPTKERELYDTARHLLVMEISASLTITECDAEDTIDVALFPPGKERPKRTAADFKAPAGDDEVADDTLDVSDDLLGVVGGDLDLPAEEAAPAEEEEAAAEEETPAKPARAKLSDEEVTHSSAAATPAKKRGRPPKAKPAPAAAAPAPPPAQAAPKKRGRPPKAKATPAAKAPAKAAKPPPKKRK